MKIDAFGFIESAFSIFPVSNPYFPILQLWIFLKPAFIYAKFLQPFIKESTRQSSQNANNRHALFQ